MHGYDVIVVGAGPGGSAAAYLLAGAGMRVALIDKARFPRDKLCGGMLSGRTEKTYKDIFGDGWEGTYEFTSPGARFFYKTQFLNEIQDYRRNYFTTRSSFDHHLVMLAQGKGAVLFERSRALSLDPDGRSVRLENGAVICGDFVIGADGSTSVIARELGLSARERVLGASLEVEIPRQGRLANIDRPEIYLGVIRWGYGWIFPKKDAVTVGIGGLAHKNSSMNSLFRAFLEQVCPKPPPVQQKGHPIPFCDLMLRLGIGNILLVGDAGGFVDPLTGEGIAFAMQSASCAAHAVLDAAGIGNPQSALQYYRRHCEPLVRLLKQASWMRYLVFPAISEKLLVRVLRRSKSVIHRFMDLLAGEIDYADYSRFLIAKLRQHFFL